MYNSPSVSNRISFSFATKSPDDLRERVLKLTTCSCLERAPREREREAREERLRVSCVAKPRFPAALRGVQRRLGGNENRRLPFASVGPSVRVRVRVRVAGGREVTDPVARSLIGGIALKYVS